MFKKRQARSLRKKSSDDEDGVNGDARSDNESRGSNGGQVVKDTEKEVASSSGTKSVPSSLLSFGDEENEGEVFQTRVPTSKRNSEKGRHRHRAEKGASKEQAAGAKVSATHFSSVKPSQKDEFIIKQIGKPINKDVEPESPVILSGRDAENVNEADAEEDPMLGKFKQVLTSGAIPDASLIHMARKQRQMAREMGTGDAPGNFIPLKKLDDTQKYKKDKSRLVREDDDNENSDSGEEGGRFYSKLHDEDEEERRQVEADFLRVEQGDSDDEKDDELERWEREQIRKGVSVNQLGYFAQEYLASNYGGDMGSYKPNSVHQQSLDIPLSKEIKEPQPMDIDIDLTNDDEEGIDVHKVAGTSRSSALPKVGRSAPVDTLATFSDLKVKLEQRLNEQVATNNARLLDREKVRDFLTENEASLAKLEDSMPNLSEQYRFYQEIRTYVRDLLDCFNEKVPMIQAATSRMMELCIGRARFLIKRRQQDIKDQYDECSAISLGKTQSLQQDSDRMMRAAEREARRTRRRQKREKTLASLGHHDGMSSDDEEAPSRIVTFNTEKEKLRAETAELFKDTEEEFYSIETIMQRFAEWRKMYRNSFNEAYVRYCLPKVLAPLVEWNILTWNPLEAGSQPLRTMDWYASLENGELSKRDESNDEDEVDLLFSVLDVAVVPRLKDIVEHVWDPTSSSQSSNLVAAVSSIQRGHPKSSQKGKRFAALKDAIRNRVKRSFDDDLFTPIYSKDVIENKASGASLFLDRQFWFSLKIIQNVSAWASVFSDSEVQEWIFDGVLNRHVVLALQCGGAADMTTLTKCKAVCSALPSSWFAGLKEGETLRQLEPFCKMLVRIADEFNGNKLMDKSSVRDATKEIYRLLMKLRGWKYAEMLSRKYKVK